MRLLTILILLLATLTTKANNKQTPTNLEKVTVYLNGAQITRTSQLTITKGTTEVVFNNLSANIQESSIQLSGLDNTSILSINYGINYLDKQVNSTEIEVLKKQLLKLNDLIQLEDNLILGFKEELSLIQSNRRLGNDTENIDLEKLKEFSSYYRKRLTEINNAIYNSRKKINLFNKDAKDLKKQLIELNVTDKLETGEIKVKLSSEALTNLNLTLKYNVTNAGWFPVYDLKSNKINTPLNLLYKAHIYQNTGLDWDDVNITLSTSDPNTNNTKPQLNPKYLNIISKYSNYRRSKATKRNNYNYNPYVQTVSGVVLDTNGMPLPGVNVIEKGSTNGTQTDFDGKYRLTIQGGSDLSFSYVGMTTEEFPIHSSIMNVNMEEDGSVLDEVVVSAMGISREEKSLGYVVSELDNNYTYMSENDILRVLSGKVSGVQITSQNGTPGGSSQIKIRGYNSISRMNKALFVIDGVPYNNSSSNLKQLDSNNIERIDVLKNKEATSLYGTQGKNGVIVITTKNNKLTSTGDIIEEGITNTTFEIKKQHSIPSNGDLTVIKINEFNIPAEFSYFAAPIVNENVFLTAKFGNWEQYNLLPGEANIYFEGAYSGKTHINPQTITDSLTISLGIDPNVIVKRTQLNNFKSKSFTGSNKIINKAYEIEVKNNKTSAITLTLMDRIPISQNKEIKVDDIYKESAEFDSKKGLLEWSVNLDKNTSRKQKFSYSIRYPKLKRINL